MPKRQFESLEDATPITDCSGLIPNWVHNTGDLNRVEAENILIAQRKYLRSNVVSPTCWFNTTQLKAVHKTMFGDVWDWAGKYRKSVTSIGVKPHLIPLQLTGFCQEVLFWLSDSVGFSILEMSARIHHGLVYIHPFENGNGRFSRLIADRFLLSFGLSHPIWPNNLNKSSADRKEYIQALKDADFGDYSALLQFMEKFRAKEKGLTLR